MKLNFLRNIIGLASIGADVRVPIGRDSLAFLCGFLEGGELSKLDLLYPAIGAAEVKPQSPKAQLKSVRVQLADLAKRTGRSWRDVRLLWIDPDRLDQVATATISRDDFCWERDPDNSYTKAELIERYKEEISPSNMVDRRRARNEKNTATPNGYTFLA